MTSAPTTDRLAPSMTIGGAPVGSEDVIPVVNPATAEVFAEVPSCTLSQLDDAVRGARASQPSWADLGWDRRRAIVLEAMAAVEDAREELARLVTLEVGKPLGNARSEITSGLTWARYFAELDEADEVVRDDAEATIVVERVPIGVVGAITAWNYPLMLALLKLAPALLAGNTVVVKPSPYTPVATLRLGEVLATVLPPGLVQVVSGGDDLGRWLTEHAQVGKISFTGSVRTGKAIMAASAGNLKRLTLELGGNDAAVVLPGQDPSRFAEPLFWGAFSNVGQVCTGVKRLFVPDDEVSAWCEAIGAVADEIVLGEGTSPDVQLGPVQNQAQLRRVQELLADAVEAGGTIAHQGACPDGPGFFHPLTIVTGVAEGVRLVDEEQFGPVLPVLGYRSVEEAVRRANATPLGLGASAWSADTSAAAATARQLEAGSVWVNRHPALTPEAPFGGLKESGLGVESGRHGLDAYSDLRVVNVRHP